MKSLSKRIEHIIINGLNYQGEISDLYEESRESNLDASKNLIDFIVNNKLVKDIDVDIYIFYHDESLVSGLSLSEGALAHINLINLNDVVLPKELLIPDVDMSLNKAMLSEYLGLISIQPKGPMVACFTYSIENKFSVEWADESGCENIFLPEVMFSEVVHAGFNEDFLYGVEFNSPYRMAEESIKVIDEKYFNTTCKSKGPFKGSFVVSKKSFFKMQSFLKQVMVDVLQFDEVTLVGVDSPYDKGSIANRGNSERKKIDARRHTYGTVFERAVALYFAHNFGNDKKIRIGEKLLSNQIKSMNLLNIAFKIAVDGYITVVCCNSAYLETLQNWVSFFAKTGVNNLLVIAMDKGILNWCEDNKIGVYLAKFSGVVSQIWFFRSEIISRLVNAGLNVLHSDIDAVWLSNPYLYFKGYNGDIIASQGTIFPKDICKINGVVLCCGFILYRGTPKTRLFFREYLKEINKYSNDQLALNRILIEKGLIWDVSKNEHSKSISHNGMTFNVYDSVISGTLISGLKIKLLPHGLFQRLMDLSYTPIVAHLLSDKTNEAKINVFKEVDKYIIKNEYLDAHESSLIWLASYPRSGNTMVRTWLKKNFLYDSFSIYNDVNDIGKDGKIKKEVGHVDVSWFYKLGKSIHLKPSQYVGFDPYRKNLSLVNFIKTHGEYHTGYENDRAIYIFRDGRAALLSHANYQVDFGGFASDLKIDRKLKVLMCLERFIVAGSPMCGYWSDNLLGWFKADNKHILFVKFEDAIKDVKNTLSLISTFTGKKVLDPELVIFKNVQKSNANFFRKGKADSWSSDYTPNLLSIFWAFNADAMLKAGYIDSYYGYWLDDPSVEQDFDLIFMDRIKYVRKSIVKNKPFLHKYQESSFNMKVSKIVDCTVSFLSEVECSKFEKEVKLWKEVLGSLVR